jgi:hypothetical protein
MEGAAQANGKDKIWMPSGENDSIREALNMDSS